MLHHSGGVGPVAYETKGLASVCCICDATHYGSGPGFEGELEEMLHHRGAVAHETE